MTKQIIMTLICIVLLLILTIFAMFKLLQAKNSKIKELSKIVEMQQNLANAVSEQKEKCRAEKESLNSGSNEEKLSKTVETLKKQRNKSSGKGAEK